MKYILRLSDSRATDPSIAGDKGAKLAQLMQAGFAVPGGFIVTPTAYWDSFAALDALKSLGATGGADAATIDQASIEIVSALRSVALPLRLVDEIATRCAEYGAGARWAVRSSGTAEDLASAAFA